MIRINRIFRCLFFCLCNLDCRCIAQQVCGVKYACSGFYQPSNVSLLSFRIIGGEKSNHGEWPWMASFFAIDPNSTDGKGNFTCGAVLISKMHALTAAHCVNPIATAKQYYIRIGNIYAERGRKFTLRRYFLHENYLNKEAHNDIALLELDKPVDHCDVPICLPPMDFDENTIAQIPVVIGWGTINPDKLEFPESLMQLKIPLFDLAKCDQIYSQSNIYDKVFTSGMSHEMICAGYKEGIKDTCSGDSGGPLMINYNNAWILIGITSFGIKCGKPIMPGTYTRVYAYLPWLYKKFTQINEVL